MSILLDRDKPKELLTYLQEKQFLKPGEELNSLEKPGEGNMNYTVRVKTNQRSFILKQARDYVEKYPSIPAPAGRAVTEGKFYELVAQDAALQKYMPHLLLLDAPQHILALEDLGIASDYTYLYQPNAQISEAEIDVLIHFLSLLHSQPVQSVNRDLFANRELRALNHEHIFRYPFMEDNGFDLDTIQPGLQEVAMPYKKDEKLKQIVTDLGELYLSDGPVLLHGDYYPGSWLKTDEGVKIIDPEFCFYGLAEFDMGVLLAHLKMALVPENIQKYALEKYLAVQQLDKNLLNQFIGVEIMRRLIGLAQLPLALSLAQKEILLKEAYQFLIHVKQN